MLPLLPLLALGGITLIVANQRQEISWRQAFLRATILTNVFLVITTEILSLIRGITRIGIALTWLLPLILIIFWLTQRRKIGQPINWPVLYFPANRMDRILVFGLFTILGVTALVAWLTPPQTWDSLRYHLPRVAHWAQEMAVRHFATGMHVQNSMTPGAEMTILHFYVLAGCPGR